MKPLNKHPEDCGLYLVYMFSHHCVCVCVCAYVCVFVCWGVGGCQSDSVDHEDGGGALPWGR